MAAPRTDSTVDRVPQSQLCLDEDDPLFGRFSRALLESGSLAALRPNEAAVASSSSSLFPRHHSIANLRTTEVPRQTIQVAIDRRDRIAEGNSRSDANMSSASAFDVQSPHVPDSTIESPQADSTNSLATSGSASWRVHSAFARTNSDADVPSNDISSPLSQPALRLEMPFRTLFNHSWFECQCAAVLLWSLPILTSFLYALSSRTSDNMATNQAVQNTLFYTIAFFVAAILTLALSFSRVETSILLKELLCTFESAYLITWIMAYLVSSFAQIPNEMAARSVELGIGTNEFIFARCASAMGILSCFLIVLCSDALIRLSVWFKIYIHCLFLLASAFVWIDFRFIHPNRIPVAICLGNAAYSCTDTIRVRIGSLFAISLFVFRNVVIMLRHEYRANALAHFGGKGTQRFLLIKSTIVLNSDDNFASSLSTAAVEPEKSITCVAPAVSAAVSSQSHDLRIVDMDHISVPEVHSPTSASDQTCESAATIRIANSSHSRSHSHNNVPGLTNLATSPGDLSVVSSPSVSPLVQNEPGSTPIACERQLLSIFSLFGIDIESHAQPQCLVFGHATGNMWRHSWFRCAAVLNFLAVFVLSFLQLPRNSVLMLCSLWTLVIMFSLFMMTLIDMRIVSELARTFEFWFLQFLNLVSFVAACSSLVNEANGKAAFVGNDLMLQLLNDICWSSIYFVGCAIIVMSDALSVRRGIKIFLNLFWITTMVRVIWWRIWFTYEQPYTLPLDVCIWIECFSVQVIRLQTSMTFVVFAAKYAFSLFRFPRALVILKSAVVISIVDDDFNQGLAGACVIEECDAVMVVAAAPDREEPVKRISD